MAQYHMLAIEPQVNRNAPSDDVGAYLSEIDVVSYERAMPGETPDLWCLMGQVDADSDEWEIIEDFDTEDGAWAAFAALVKTGG